MFKKDPQKLVDYNLRDAELVYKILESSKTLEFFTLSYSNSITSQLINFKSNSYYELEIIKSNL